jgi:hypothetical protein
MKEKNGARQILSEVPNDLNVWISSVLQVFQILMHATIKVIDAPLHYPIQSNPVDKGDREDKRFYTRVTSLAQSVIGL